MGQAHVSWGLLWWLMVGIGTHALRLLLFVFDFDQIVDALDVDVRLVLTQSKRVARVVGKTRQKRLVCLAAARRHLSLHRLIRPVGHP